MVLLSHLEAYVEHFTQEQLKKVILPQVGAGSERAGGRLPTEPSRGCGSGCWE